MIRLNNSKISTLVPSKHENRENECIFQYLKRIRKHTHTHTHIQSWKQKNKNKEIMHIENKYSIYSLKKN
jgi:hypothetical protein